MNDQRIQFLTAMGIDAWQANEQPTEVIAPVTAEATPQEDKLDWKGLQAQIAQCERCSLCKTRTQTVFGVGNPNADLMFIGEAPGANEDAQGEPFVGKAGQLLNAMLAAIGLQRESVFIANILKCRPPNNRDPQPEEVATCTPYLLKQIEQIQPKVIVALGRIAAQFLLNTEASLGKLRGSLHQYHDTPLIITYHPAYLLRSPNQKAKSWQDLQLIKQQLS